MQTRASLSSLSTQPLIRTSSGSLIDRRTKQVTPAPSEGEPEHDRDQDLDMHGGEVNEIQVEKRTSGGETGLATPPPSSPIELDEVHEPEHDDHENEVRPAPFLSSPLFRTSKTDLTQKHLTFHRSRSTHSNLKSPHSLPNVTLSAPNSLPYPLYKPNSPLYNQP